jgi:ectoine hydroxylase
MLNDHQKRKYLEEGYFVYPRCLSGIALEHVRRSAELCLKDTEDPGLVNEKDGSTVRGLHGTHLRNDVMAKLCRHPTLLEIAKDILGTDVYVHQFKLNVKAAFVGDVWEWHQDMTFYHREDELPNPEFLTIAVFLDEVTEFNGPLLVIPCSHIDGFRETKRIEIEEHDAQNSWLSSTTAKLRYMVEPETLRKLVGEFGLRAPKGAPGDCIVFHANLFHGSGVNMSPFDRRIVFISYNSVKNLPQPTRPLRPEFLAGRNFSSLEPSDDLFI